MPMSNEAARALGRRRHAPEIYARSIARRWPKLDAKTRAEVREVLVPVLVADASGSDRK